MSWYFKWQLQYYRKKVVVRNIVLTKIIECVSILQTLFIQIIRDTTYTGDDEVNVKGGWEKGGTKHNKND